MAIKKIAEIVYSDKQREAFKNDLLRNLWAKQYPMLFDKNDISNAKNQPKNHFFEWLAAIVIFNTTGNLSLVEKYEFQNQPRKRKILKMILNKDQLDILGADKRQCPDLFVYSSDYKDWFFCEVKGHKDKLRVSQRNYFRQLEKTLKKPVYVIHFKKQ
jgi:hypothetical protein